MKKRLRKKLHRGEFKELGFYLHFSLPEDLTEEQLDGFVNQFFTEVIEAQRLDYTGSGGVQWQGFVTSLGPSSTMEQQRAEVAGWLQNHAQVLHHEVGELRDAWHDPRG